MISAADPIRSNAAWCRASGRSRSGLDVDEREALHRAGVDPRAADVGQARRDDQVLPSGLERPAQLADPLRGQVVGARDDDGVRSGRRQGCRDVVDAAVALDGGSWQQTPRAVGHRRADHAVAGFGCPGELPCDVQHARRRADEQHPRGVPAVLPLGDEPLAPHPAREQQHEDADGERDEHVAAGQVDAQQVGSDRDQPEHPDARVRDQPVLGAPDADDAVTTGVVERQPDHPDGDDDHGDAEVAQAQVRRVRHQVRVEPEPGDLHAEHDPDQRQQVGDEHATRVRAAPLAGAPRGDGLVDGLGRHRRPRVTTSPRRRSTPRRRRPSTSRRPARSGRARSRPRRDRVAPDRRGGRRGRHTRRRHRLDLHAVARVGPDAGERVLGPVHRERTDAVDRHGHPRAGTGAPLQLVGARDQRRAVTAEGVERVLARRGHDRVTEHQPLVGHPRAGGTGGPEHPGGSVVGAGADLGRALVADADEHGQAVGGRAQRPDGPHVVAQGDG